MPLDAPTNQQTTTHAASIEVLWQKITEHPDYLGGTVFCVRDAVSVGVEVDDVYIEKIEDLATAAGWAGLLHTRATH